MNSSRMKALSFVLFVCVTTILISCLSKKDGGEANVEDPNAFGAVFDPAGHITADSLLLIFDKSDAIDGISVKGRVESVCKVKGCWMQLVADQRPDETIFVKFKDYGFFVPLDCEGRELVMHGKAFKEITPVDELRHYAEDEGLSEAEIAAITEPKEELKFMADGVKFLN